MPRKTKIQLLTKTDDSTTALSTVDLDLGEPLVDNTSTGKTVVIGGHAHTATTSNKADNSDNIILGASHTELGKVEDVKDTSGNTTGQQISINHIDNIQRSSYILKTNGAQLTKEDNTLTLNAKYTLGIEHIDDTAETKITLTPPQGSPISGNIADPDWDTKVLNRPQMYLVNRNTYSLEGPTEAELAGCYSEDSPHHYDIIVISTRINEADASKGIIERRSSTAYFYDAYTSNWKALDGNYSAENVFLSRDMTITKTFGKHIVNSGNRTPYHAGDSIQHILLDAFSESSYGTVDYPSHSFTTSNVSQQVGTITSIPSATFKVTDVGSYQYGPATGITFSGNIKGGEKYESNEMKDHEISFESLTKNGTASLTYGQLDENNNAITTITVTDAPQTFTFTGTYSYTAGAEAKSNLDPTTGNTATSGFNIPAISNQPLSTSATISGWRYMYYGTANGYANTDIVGTAFEKFAKKTYTFTASKGAKYVVFAVPSNNNTGTTNTTPSIKYFENGSYVTFPGTFTKTTATIGPDHVTTGNYTTTYNVWYYAAPNQTDGLAEALDFQITIY